MDTTLSTTCVRVALSATAQVVPMTSVSTVQLVLSCWWSMEPGPVLPHVLLPISSTVSPISVMLAPSTAMHVLAPPLVLPVIMPPISTWATVSPLVLLAMLLSLGFVLDASQDAKSAQVLEIAQPATQDSAAMEMVPVPLPIPQSTAVQDTTPTPSETVLSATPLVKPAVEGW